MKKVFSILATLVLVIMSVAALPVTSASAASSWPSVTSSKTIQFIATSTFPVYKDSGLKTRGTASPLESNSVAEVWAGDDCFVVKIVSNSVVLIDYPAGGRRKQAYCSRAKVFPSLPSAFSAQAGVKTYKRPNGSGGQFGSIDKNDYSYYVGQQSGTYAYGVIYPLTGSGGKMKLGWLSASDYQKITAATGTQANLVTKYLHGVENWKQYDSRWKDTKISTKTIGQVGCLVTCMAMSEGYRQGKSIRPDTMRNSLSFSGNDMYWPSNYYTLATGKGNDALKKVYNTINTGRPVIVGADSSSSSHWVLIYGYKDLNTNAMNAANFLINDPNSSSRTTLQAFLNSYSSGVIFKTYK